MSEFLTIADVAERYAVSCRTVRNWIARGIILAYRPGGRVIRIDAHSLSFLHEEVQFQGITRKGGHRRG
jgi:excisionase family DNA binding protein